MGEDLKLILIPREAYRFWPTETIARRGFGRFAQRMIFNRQEFSDLEEQALAEMYELVESDEALREQVLVQVEKTDLLRVIYAAEWDMSAVKDRLKRYMQWKETVLAPIRLLGSDVLFLPILSSGGFYTFGRDCYYRPILLLTPSRLHSVPSTQFPIELVLKALCYALDYIESNMMLPGQIENWVLVVDMEGTQQLPKQSLQVGSRQDMKAALEGFLVGFPCRLAAGFVWKVNRALWARVTVILSPETSGKFVFISESSKGELLKIVNRTQLESRFGGLAGTKQTYWPPDPAGTAVYSTSTTVLLGDYSSFQEYYPERSVSLADDTELSGFSSDVEDRQRVTSSVIVSPMHRDEIAETEEGPTLIRPVKVSRLSIDFAKSIDDHPPRRRRIVSVEAHEGTGYGCYCLTNKQSSEHSSCSVS